MNVIVSAFLESDKLKKATSKKKRSEHIAALYDEIGEHTKAKAVMDCGTYREYGAMADGRTHLLNANFCHLRMCPQCAWLLSRKRAVDLFRCLAEPEHLNKRYIFLTLTVRNCKADELTDTINKMYAGLRSWTYKKNSFLSKRTLGLIKKLEITYNRKDKTFHPHFHIFCEVEEKYFTDKALYLSGYEYAEKWRQTLNLDYHPQCKVEAVHKGDTKGVLETVKYSAKDEDYGYSSDVFKIFCDALHGRRLYTPMGSFKETMKRLKMNPDDFENSTQDVELSNNPYILKFALVWNTGLKQYRVKIIEQSNINQLVEDAGKELSESVLSV